MTGLGFAFAKAWGHAHRDRYLWGALYVGCAAYFFFHFIRHPAGGELYRHAAQCLWDQKVLQVCDPAFTYTPTFAFIMLPSIAMPMLLMLAIWFAITVACAIWSCRLCERLVVTNFQGKWPDRDREWLRLFSILISLKFLLAVFENQGFDLLVLPLILIGVLASQRLRLCDASASGLSRNDDQVAQALGNPGAGAKLMIATIASWLPCAGGVERGMELASEACSACLRHHDLHGRADPLRSHRVRNRWH